MRLRLTEITFQYSCFILFISLLSIFTAPSFAQENNCNILITKNLGKPLHSITIHSKFADITLAKQDTIYYLGFQKKGFYNLVRGGMAQYKLDSVGVRLGRKSISYYKTEGVGISPEMLTQPLFWGTYFSIKLSAAQWNYLKTKTITAFYTYGEKRSKGTDKIERSSGKKIKKGFECL